MSSPSLSQLQRRIRPEPSPDGSARVDRVLLAGPGAGVLARTVRRIMPEVEVEAVETTLDGLAELALAADADPFDVVIAEAREPAEVAALRDRLDAAGQASRLILAGPEPLPDLLRHGADAWLDLPAGEEAVRGKLLPTDPAPAAPRPAVGVPELDVATLLEAQTRHPGRSVQAAVKLLDARLGGAGDLRVGSPAEGDARELTVAIAGSDLELTWHREVADAAEADVIRHDLSALAGLLGKLAGIDRRHEGLKRLALYDELTGCATKRFFNITLDRALAVARRERFPVTLLLFDIDDFKQYNDDHGHAVGDQILKQTGELMRRCVRDADFVARIGGDEFAVIFREETEGDGQADADDRAEKHRRTGRVPKGPLQIAARFRRLMGDEAFGALGATGVGRLTISGGMAVFPYDATDAAGLVAKADQALVFGAKRLGKNTISLVGDDPASGH